MRSRVRRQLASTLALAGVWWLLSGGEPASWIVGVPAVASASWLAYRLRDDGPAVSLIGAARFVPFFLWESLRGGLDVARRTLAPKLRISPGFTVYRTSLSDPKVRVFFVGCVNLLPGTLAADLEDDRVNIHQLDVAVDVGADLRRLERAVQRLFPTRAPGGEV